MKTKNLVCLFLLATLGCGVMPSCTTEYAMDTSNGDGGEYSPGEMEDIVYMLPEPQRIELAPAQRTFATDNNQFALNFLKTVSAADPSGKSFIYSPLSITYVLAMVNAAAEGQTSREMEQVLGFGEGGSEAINQYCKTLIEGLPLVDPNVQLSIANAIYLNNRYTLKPQFQHDMQHYYCAQAEALDFGSPATLNRINNWCNEQTRGMIPNILNQLNPEAVSYLLNAIYFKAGWTSKFNPQKTKSETFTREDGTTAQLPLMQQTVLANYTANDLYSGVCMKYGSGMWEMTILLPNEGRTTDEVIDSLGQAGWPCGEYGPMSGARPCEVDLKVPRFGTKSDTDQLDGELPGVLRQMGIRQVFDSDFAQVPNLCEDINVFISLMRQKAAIEVNEDGAEASAVTVAGMEVTSAGPMEYTRVAFHAVRPFVYLIREASSGVLLFVGKYAGE